MSSNCPVSTLASEIRALAQSENAVAAIEAYSRLGLLKLISPALAEPKIGTDPVYLILAMTADQVLRMKPQNLVVGLPVRRLERVT